MVRQLDLMEKFPWEVILFFVAKTNGFGHFLGKMFSNIAFFWQQRVAVVHWPKEQISSIGKHILCLGIFSACQTIFIPRHLNPFLLLVHNKFA